MSAPIIEVRNLAKTYLVGTVVVKALRRIDLTVNKGDFLAVLGPSGSGKSTLLNLLGALDTPTEGSVLIDSVDISTLTDDGLADLRRRIGFVFQFFNLIPRLSARGNVELATAIVNVSRTERRRQAEELLETVGLRERMNHKPAELSGGERQRVAIARALANNPKFLLMDEPTGNIDSQTAKDILKLVSQLNEVNRVTIIVITHDRYVASQAKRTVQLLDGRIVPDEVQ